MQLYLRSLNMLKPINVGKFLFKFINTWISLKTGFSILILTFVCSPLFAQNLDTKSKKAEKLYYEAQTQLTLRNYDGAIPFLQQAIEKDAEFTDALYLLGVCYQVLFKNDDAKVYYERAQSLDKEGRITGLLFHLGEIYFKEGKYKESKELLEKFMATNPKGYNKDQAEGILENATYAVEGVKKKIKFSPHPLPEKVNCYALQYFPVLTVDESSLFYTRRLGSGASDDEDIVVSHKDSSGVWSSPVSVSEKINTQYNEGTCTISADGRMLIFTSCYGRKGEGSCDLFVSTKEGDDWSDPVNMGVPINSQAWESQPALSSDGRTLYFVSDRGGGYGKRDIWMSTMNDNEQWTPPVNLGPHINSAEDEVSPFLHANGRTLYFASKGRLGFGGFDIYYTELSEDGWSEPENIGYPINTSDDQVSLFITADGSKGYYSHEEIVDGLRASGKLYEFDIPPEIQVAYKSNYVKGRIFDAVTKNVLKASVELYDVESDEKKSKVESDSKTGEYMIVLTQGAEYALYVNKTGYLFQSLAFNYLEERDLDPINIDIYLKPISEGIKTTLNNIFFEFDSYELQDKSKTELNEVNRFLTNNPTINVEIEGHTDNKGSNEYNNELSLKRAKAVYDYLINLGIPAGRMKYKGYGSKQPVASNETEEGMAKNRRIEFRVIK